MFLKSSIHFEYITYNSSPEKTLSCNFEIQKSGIESPIMNFQEKKIYNNNKVLNKCFQEMYTSYIWLVILQSYFIPKTNNISYIL